MTPCCVSWFVSVYVQLNVAPGATGAEGHVLSSRKPVTCWPSRESGDPRKTTARRNPGAMKRTSARGTRKCFGIIFLRMLGARLGTNPLTSVYRGREDVVNPAGRKSTRPTYWK